MDDDEYRCPQCAGEVELVMSLDPPELHLYCVSDTEEHPCNWVSVHPI